MKRKSNQDEISSREDVQSSRLMKQVMVSRERRIWNRKKAYFDTIEDSEIFRPKKELSSDKSELKLPKVKLKVLY